ncbi:hypothetical protein PAXRUDRAFT_25993 [Paxillus rubicundulus Ve08.2h10]|uniref:Uncharacterized protein n=1 Tax=Paxillus rubicundulus Ve08.2h10 TaxID=930991 RepID=A0A0D0E1M3_9AGAM|nr:hypothetical protein PAXRUDRAFT_25993 [Paxillus rubicundulus Ve08.2h10]
MADLNPASSPSASASASSSPSLPSIPSWAICFIAIAFIGKRRCVDDTEGRRAEMVQGSREDVDGASIMTVVGPPPPVYAPKSSSPEPPLYRSTEDVTREAEAGRAVHPARQPQQQETLVLSSEGMY